MTITGKLLRKEKDTIYMQQNFVGYIYKVQKNKCEINGNEVLIPDYVDGTRVYREEYAKLFPESK